MYFLTAEIGFIVLGGFTFSAEKLRYCDEFIVTVLHFFQGFHSAFDGGFMYVVQ